MISKEELIKWKYDENFQLEAVRQNGHSIQFIHNPLEEIKLEAVKQDGRSIKYIHNPSEKVKLEAVINDSSSIQYIHNPSFEMCNEALNNTKRKYLDYIIRYIDIEKYPQLYEKYCFMRR